MDEFTVNDRTYHLPGQPVVVICVDGCEEGYLDVALTKERMPRTDCLLTLIAAMKWIRSQ